MREQDAAVKRIVALSCLGVDIYMLVLYAVQLGMAYSGSFVISLLPELMDYANMMNGLCMLAAVLSGAVVLWLYVQEAYDGALVPYGVWWSSKRRETHGNNGRGDGSDLDPAEANDTDSNAAAAAVDVQISSAEADKAEADNTKTQDTDIYGNESITAEYGSSTWKSQRSVIFHRHRHFGIRACISFAALMYIVQLLAMIVQSIAELIFNAIGYTVMASPAAEMDYTVGRLILLYALLVGPAIEELVFRGFLLNALRPLGKAYAVLISAVMFSLMHADVEQIFFTFAAGLILGYVAAEYSIWASLILHIINNGIYGELLLYLQEVLPEAVYVAIALMLMLGSIVLGIVLAVRYRGSIKEFISSNPTVPGAYRALCNRWFIAFAACMIGLTWTTVTRL